MTKFTQLSICQNMSIIYSTQVALPVCPTKRLSLISSHFAIFLYDTSLCLCSIDCIAYAKNNNNSVLFEVFDVAPCKFARYGDLANGTLSHGTSLCSHSNGDTD